MPFPRLGRFGSHPSHPRRLVRFASMHVPTEVRSAAVRMPCGRLCLLPRLSVSIVFKMFSCQSFKTLRLFGMALLYGYRGGRFQSRRFVVPSSVPPRRGRADCLRPLRRRPSCPSCRYPSPASRSPPRPSDTIDGAGGCGRPTACSAGRRTGRAVSSWMPCVRAAACPMCATDRPPPCRPPHRLRSSVPFPHGSAAHPFLSCSHFNIAPPIDTRNGEKDGAGACSGRCE